METFGLDTPIGLLLDNPKSRAVLEKYVPKLVGHPLVKMARGMKLRDVLPYAKGQVSQETVQKILADLGKL